MARCKKVPAIVRFVSYNRQPSDTSQHSLRSWIASVLILLLLAQWIPVLPVGLGLVAAFGGEHRIRISASSAACVVILEHDARDVPTVPRHSHQALTAGEFLRVQSEQDAHGDHILTFPLLAVQCIRDFGVPKGAGRSIAAAAIPAAPLRIPVPPFLPGSQRVSQVPAASALRLQTVRTTVLLI